MINGLRVSVVLPCRNEEECIAELLASMPPEVDEVVVADNRSSDRTRSIAASMGAVVVNEPRVDSSGIGYGYAVRAGMLRATGDVIVTMDADGTYPAHRIVAMVNELAARNLDFLSCTRLPRIEKEEKLWVRITGVVVLNIATRMLFGYAMRDCLTGMMVFKRDLLATRTWKEGGWDFNVEIKLVPMVDPNLRFGEAHIPYHDRIVNMSKQQIFRTGFGHLWYLFRFRWTSVNRQTSRTRSELAALGSDPA